MNIHPRQFEAAELDGHLGTGICIEVPDAHGGLPSMIGQFQVAGDPEHVEKLMNEAFSGPSVQRTYRGTLVRLDGSRQIESLCVQLQPSFDGMFDLIYCGPA